CGRGLYGAGVERADANAGDGRAILIDYFAVDACGGCEGGDGRDNGQNEKNAGDARTSERHAADLILIRWPVEMREASRARGIQRTEMGLSGGGHPLGGESVDRALVVRRRASVK